VFGVVVPFVRAATDVTGRHPLREGNGNMPGSMLGQEAIRKGRCNMAPKSQNLGTQKRHRGVHC
jgi:hypothetical protein